VCGQSHMQTCSHNNTVARKCRRKWKNRHLVFYRAANCDWHPCLSHYKAFERLKGGCTATNVMQEVIVQTVKGRILDQCRCCSIHKVDLLFTQRDPTWLSQYSEEDTCRTKEESSSIPIRGKRFFCSIWTGPGAIQTPMMPKLPGVKRPGREAEHSPLFSTDIRNTWSYTCIPAYLKKNASCDDHEPVQCSEWLRVRRQRGRSSSARRVKNFHFSKSSRPSLGSTQPPIQWVPGAISPGLKRQGREADHSSPTSAEVKKMWIYTSIPPYAFTA
jgi:hypothetical protein